MSEDTAATSQAMSGAATERTEAPLAPSTIRELIDKSVTLLETKCIRLKGHDPNWRGLFTENRDDIMRSSSPAELEARFNAVLSRGGLSHVAFFHGTGPRAPMRYAINATLLSADTPEGPRWLFQDVHEGGPAHGAGIRGGDLLTAVDGERVEPPTLPVFALGEDHAVTVENSNGQSKTVQVILPKAETHAKAPSKPPMAEPASVTAREIRPGIGHLRVAFFPASTGKSLRARSMPLWRSCPGARVLSWICAATSEGLLAPCG
jgi:hypothetical protein